MKYSPVCLFTYNRLAETKQTVEALKANFLATESDLFVFSDFWACERAMPDVLSVREFLGTVEGFKSVTIFERNENYGLAKSIIAGVSKIVEEYGRVIVLEDDLVTSPNFLTFMNDGLRFYQLESKVWSVSGFSFPITYHKGYEFDATFGVRASSWGWGTWVDRWQKVDWTVSDYQDFASDRRAKIGFKQGGSDLCKMLKDQMTGRIDSWAIRFCYAQFRDGAFDVYPRISKVKNIGFGEGGTHTGGMDTRFDTVLDEGGGTRFNFPGEVVVDRRLLAQFKVPFSVWVRLKFRVLRLFR